MEFCNFPASCAVPEAGITWCVQGFLSVNGIKFYESKMNLNWKPIIKSIQEVCSLIPVPSHLHAP